MASRGWTCQRVSGGVKCGKHNPARLRKCAKCGKQRPARKKPEHMAALDFDYDHYVSLNGSNTCAICGRKPSARRRLDRDHDHATGRPRGLLCARCNRSLPGHVTTDWLKKALAYLERAEAME